MFLATAGALGYRAPELSKIKKANTKSDVYSLGVIILEILTGKSPGDELLNTLKLGLHCVDPSPAARPDVQQVLQQLEEIKPELGATSVDDGTKVPPLTNE
ncbi:putative leucine-rich repeat receptor-like protein kinase IMK3 [Vitis vinifera]|uniref:Putative leucine-rich repeat receptor-like protein kinase IMK3 n=1 Tax=Vitis vinifera TaxID=29760 RepID=A0A438FTA0_VITVI|nr:putative leucine-rich repeat receptor-like protein kinase IMK3 [Vitis vinifera]